MSAHHPSGRRPWLLIAIITGAMLAQAGVYLGLQVGAFVAWNSIHAFYFQQSYKAGSLPLVAAGGLALTILLLLLKRPRWAVVPAFGAMFISALMLPRMGMMSILHPYIHPMQTVHWAAMMLTMVGCFWLFGMAKTMPRT